MSFNLESGELNTNNIPKEWQEIFTSIKVSKEDLKNKDIVGVIVEETILHQAKKQA